MSNIDNYSYVVQKANAIDQSGASPLILPAERVDKHDTSHRRDRHHHGHHHNQQHEHNTKNNNNDDDDDNPDDLKSNTTEDSGSFYESGDDDDAIFFDDDEEDAGEGFGSYNIAFRNRNQHVAGQAKRIPGQVVLWDSAAQKPMEAPVGLRTWDGVFMPVTVNLLGVIVFVKLPYLVAQTGLVLFWGLLAVCYIVSGLTTISVAALSTNGSDRFAGGPYWLVSRNLGSAAGLAVGSSFLLGNLVTGGFFLTGSSHFALKVLHVDSIEQWSQNEQYTSTVVTATVLLMLLLGIALLGYSRGFRILALGCMVVAFIDIIVVCITAHNLGVHGLTGFGWDRLHDNLWPQFTNGLTWEAALGVLFPSVGGILCGITLSGEIRHAAKAIPRGIGYAWIVTLLIYMVISFFIAASFDRTVLAADERSSLMDVSHKYLYIPGALASCCAAVLANVVGSSRVFYAMLQDDLIANVPLFEWLRQRSMTQCVLLCWGFMQVAIFAIGVHYNSASIVGSIVILSSYLALSLGCFLAGVSGVASFRPLYDIFSNFSALLATLASFVAMFVIWPLGAAGVICLHFTAQYLFGQNMDPSRVTWGDASQPVTFFMVRKLLLNLDERKEHLRHWRPSLLHVITDIHLSQNLIHLANNIKKGGLYELLHVLKGDFHSTAPACHAYKRFLLDYISASGMKAFTIVTFGEQLRLTLQQAVRGAGLGGMRPNSVLMSLDELLDAPKHSVARAPTQEEIAMFSGAGAHAGVNSSVNALRSVMSRLSSVDGSDLQRQATDDTVVVVAGKVLPGPQTSVLIRRAAHLLTQPDLVRAGPNVAYLQQHQRRQQPQSQAQTAQQEKQQTQQKKPDDLSESLLNSMPRVKSTNDNTNTNILSNSNNNNDSSGSVLASPNFRQTTGSFHVLSDDNSNNTGVAAQSAAAAFSSASIAPGIRLVSSVGNINNNDSPSSPLSLPNQQSQTAAAAPTAPPAAQPAAASIQSPASKKSAAAKTTTPAPPLIPPPGGFPSDHEQRPFRATLNEDLGDEERVHRLLANLRLHRDLAIFGNGTDSLTYKDPAEFIGMAHDIVKLHLNLYLARNMHKLDGPRIRNEGSNKPEACALAQKEDEEELQRIMQAAADEHDDRQQRRDNNRSSTIGDQNKNRSNNLGSGDLSSGDELLGRSKINLDGDNTNKPASSGAADGKPLEESHKRPFYIDLISPDPSDAVMFLTAYCLSMTAVWKRGAVLRVIDFVPTQLDIDDATIARKHMLKLRRIKAEVKVIALDTLPPRAHSAVDAILEADIVHHQQMRMQRTMSRTVSRGAAAAMMMQRGMSTRTMSKSVRIPNANRAACGNIGEGDGNDDIRNNNLDVGQSASLQARGNSMSRQASAAFRRSNTTMSRRRAKNNNSLLGSPERDGDDEMGSSSRNIGSSRDPSGLVSPTSPTAGGGSLSPQDRMRQRWHRIAENLQQADESGEPADQMSLKLTRSMARSLLPSASINMDRTVTVGGAGDDDTMDFAKTMMSAAECMRSDLHSNGTEVSSRASDIGYIRRVLASSSKRSQLVNAVYRNMPELTKRTGIVFARVPTFPAGPLTDPAGQAWLQEVKQISEDMPPMLMCCGEGILAAAEDW